MTLSRLSCLLSVTINISWKLFGGFMVIDEETEP